MISGENLLIIAMEECAEIQQEISKALRFGVDSHHPDEPDIDNGERVLREYYQLKMVMNELMARRIIPPISEREQTQIMFAKRDSIEKWEEYSKDLGIVI